MVRNKKKRFYNFNYFRWMHRQRMRLLEEKAQMAIALKKAEEDIHILNEQSKVDPQQLDKPMDI